MEIGGSAQSAEGLSSQSLLNELRDKALPGEYVAAVRLISRQRAGLLPAEVQPGASAIERAMRVFVDEDRRVIDELNRLLGPRRAEHLLNHPDTDHSNHTFGVGPEKPEQ